MGSVRIKGKLHDKNIRPFIKWLTKKYPVPVNVSFNFLDAHGIRYRGAVCTGLCAARAFEDYTTPTHGFTVVLSTIAHEYFHAMQVYLYGIKSPKFNDPYVENPAGLFGWKEARAAIAEGIVEYP